MRPAAPLRWRRHAGGGWHVLADGFEQLADEAFRRPVGKADLSAGTAHPHHLVRRLLLVRSKHHAECRQHDIEARILERQRLGVGLAKDHRQPVGPGTLTAALEQGADIIRRHHLGEPPRRGERRIAVAGGNVEDALIAAQVDGLAQHLADDLKGDTDDGIVAGRPCTLLTALDRGEIRGGGGGLDVHGWLPFRLGLIVCRSTVVYSAPNSVLGRGRVCAFRVV